MTFISTGNGRAVLLGALPINSNFTFQDLSIVGRVVNSNDCEVCVQFRRKTDVSTHVTYWSPHTVVIPCAEGPQDVVQLDPTDLKCPKCQKQCSSRPGLTLHIKSCTVHANGAVANGAAANGDTLRCPKCGKQCSSTSGYTLHSQRCQATPAAVTN